LKIDEYFKLTDTVLQTLIELDQAIFDIPFNSEELKNILTANKDIIILIIARLDDEAVGFKIGHHLKNKTFYSMSGGVTLAHRQMGIARALMERQHELLRQRGYELVRTNTRNKFKDMLIFNLSFGFDIIGVSQSTQAQELSIILECQLTK
jgi:ribosomal protein S18 acetylase RimI-like enzyme